MKKISKLGMMALSLSLTLPSIPVKAHTLWINVTPGTEGTALVATSIGYGHLMPTEETLVPSWGDTTLAKYEVINPEGKRSPLGLLELVRKPIVHENGLAIQNGSDSGFRRVEFSEESINGTYQFAAETPVFRFYTYQDKNGDKQSLENPPENINVRDLGTISSTEIEMNYLSAAYAYNEWTTYQPVGHVLEIMPLSNLKTLKSGEQASFQVLFEGKPLDQSVFGKVYINAFSSAYSGTEHLTAELNNDGTGSFKLPFAGHWRIDMEVKASSERVKSYHQKNYVNATVLLESTFVFYMEP